MNNFINSYATVLRYFANIQTVIFTFEEKLY